MVTQMPPAVILVEPQLGENIGAAARAMANFGLSDLRLVRPRERWPNKKALAMAANASHVIEQAKLFPSVAEASRDLELLFATTARDRKMAKHVLTPQGAARKLRLAFGRGHRSGLMFGPERAGLDNDDLSLADAIITIPTTAGFSSLNLGQAVLLLGYEWFRLADKRAPTRIDHCTGRPATRQELFDLFRHLESELDEAGFLYPAHKRPAMVRNLRAMLHRAALTGQEVRTLRGVISALVQDKRSGRRSKP